MVLHEGQTGGKQSKSLHKQLEYFYEFAKDMRKAPIQKASYKINTYVEDTDAPKGYFLTNAKKLTFVEKLAGNFGKQPFSGLAIMGNDLL